MTDAAERLRRRYPRNRVPRPVLLSLVGALALVFGGWVLWSAWYHAHPAVVGQVTAFQVLGNDKMAVTLTVDRPDPAVPARCRVIAQALDFQPVAEQQVQVPPSVHQTVEVRLTLTTLRRATSASVQECST